MWSFLQTNCSVTFSCPEKSTINPGSSLLQGRPWPRGRWARDLFELVRSQEVSDVTISPYGIKYEVRGALTGPNSRTLHVVTIWITLAATGETRFVTLFPDREAHR